MTNALIDYFSDVNECETGDNDCGLYVKCVNLPGTFKCVCSWCNTCEWTIMFVIMYCTLETACYNNLCPVQYIGEGDTPKLHTT